MTRSIRIDIISDVICPWCFIGKRRLERAMSIFRDSTSNPSSSSSSSSPNHSSVQSEGVKFDITWHPFYLSPPDSPVTNKLARYESKFGAARVKQMLPYMLSVGAGEGIAFDYGGDIGGTVVPHRLIDYVQRREPGKTDLCVETLFRSYFERRGNVFTVPHLLALLESENVGLKMDEVEQYLLDKQGREEMNALVERREEGVTGVPFFIIDGKYRLSGAQEPEAFLEIFKRITEA